MTVQAPANPVLAQSGTGPNGWVASFTPSGKEPYLAATLWAGDFAHGAVIESAEPRETPTYVGLLFSTLRTIDPGRPGDTPFLSGLGIILERPGPQVLEQLTPWRFPTSPAWMVIASAEGSAAREHQEAWVLGHRRVAGEVRDRRRGGRS